MTYIDRPVCSGLDCLNSATRKSSPATSRCLVGQELREGRVNEDEDEPTNPAGRTRTRSDVEDGEDEDERTKSKCG